MNEIIGVAGEKLDEGDVVYFGKDGKLYKSVKPKEQTVREFLIEKYPNFYRRLSKIGIIQGVPNEARFFIDECEEPIITILHLPYNSDEMIKCLDEKLTKLYSKRIIYDRKT